MESVRIAPEPGDDERQAILAALAAEDAERSATSAWAGALLPGRGFDDDASRCGDLLQRARRKSRELLSGP